MKCSQECLPDGFNLLVNFDKLPTAYYMHLPQYVKQLMDMYDLIKIKYFTKKGYEVSFLEDEKTHFFLRGDGTPFQKLELKRLSSELKIDVTSFEFRKMSSTWGQTHPNEEIRNAESSTLQHSKGVAKDRYHLAKQLQPVMYTQTYTKECNSCPPFLQRMLDDKYSPLESVIREKENYRSEKRIEQLEKKKADMKNVMYENRSLSIHNKIRGCDGKYFIELVEEATGHKMDELVSQMKPTDWRDFIVRAVCMSKGDVGNQIRFMWIKMYKVTFSHLYI